MQRDVLLATNKAQVDNSKDDIVDALDDLIHVIDGVPPDEEIDPSAIMREKAI
jgi:hypothetical protein